MADFTALNLVSFYIFIHYTKGQKDFVRQEVQKSFYPVCILADDQAFLVQDNGIVLVSTGEEVVA